ncbi:MAG: AMP-binding protein [Lacinutrix venerupis]
MIPHYSKIHSNFKFNGKKYTSNELKELSETLINSDKEFKNHIGNFLKDWLNDKESINLKTSGSTGKPKTITFSKQRMINSAFATKSYFKLQPGDKALLCLPAHYIAGKMMLVRAMLTGLELDCIEPKIKLKINQSKTYHFSAMVPLQLKANLDIVSNIKTLIIGGAKVSENLIFKIQDLKTTIFETYGMTETVSHIAVKQLNNFLPNISQSKAFKALPSITLTTTNNNCLIINAPLLSDSEIVTNDVVKLHSNKTFEWLGRADNIINSGGVKVFPEQVENKLSNKINRRFFIASEKDDILGERVIIVVEGEEIVFKDTMFNDLENYSKPKKIYFITKFLETSSGKIQRKKTLQLLKSSFKL